MKRPWDYNELEKDSVWLVHIYLICIAKALLLVFVVVVMGMVYVPLVVSLLVVLLITLSVSYGIRLLRNIL